MAAFRKIKTTFLPVERGNVTPKNQWMWKKRLIRSFNLKFEGFAQPIKIVEDSSGCFAGWLQSPYFVIDGASRLSTFITSRVRYETGRKLE